ncbi:MAG TPA: type II secretion system F family protein [Acidimicrobiia bacterium]|nr:type II secretion system F family protein [Acidimicrobiia bacterium]
MRLIAAVFAWLAGWSLGGLHIRVPGPRRGLRPRSLLLAGAAGALTTATMVLVSPPAVAVVAGVAAMRIPAAVEERARRNAERARADAWPDLLEVVRSRLAAGDDIPTALTSITSGPLAGIAEAADRGRRRGVPLAESLDGLRRTWADPTADRVIVTLAAASRSGGARVADVITALAESVADELRLRRTHEAETTQQRLTALVALVAPWVLLGFSIATNPQAATAFGTGEGSAVVVAGGVATAVGHVVARRTVRLSSAPRVFR